MKGRVGVIAIAARKKRQYNDAEGGQNPNNNFLCILLDFLL